MLYPTALTPVFTYTVQTFNSCTSRPDVWQCLVVHTRLGNMSKNKPSTRSLRIKVTFSFEVIHAQETGWQSGVRSYNMPGLPTHSMQELNAALYITSLQLGSFWNFWNHLISKGSTIIWSVGNWYISALLKYVLLTICTLNWLLSLTFVSMVSER